MILYSLYITNRQENLLCLLQESINKRVLYITIMLHFGAIAKLFKMFFVINNC